MIEHFLKSRYVRGGRVWPELDCYGLVRLARAELFAQPLLPLCSDAEPGRLREITRSVGEVSGAQDLRPCSPRPGAIATGWRASLCVHVGLVVAVDGRLRILETDEPAGPTLTRINTFETRYTRVIFYDQNLS